MRELQYEPASRESIKLVHTATYVDALAKVVKQHVRSHVCTPLLFLCGPTFCFAMVLAPCPLCCYTSICRKHTPSVKDPDLGAFSVRTMPTVFHTLAGACRGSCTDICHSSFVRHRAELNRGCSGAH